MCQRDKYYDTLFLSEGKAMKVSLTGAFRNYTPTYGYGVAAHNIEMGLKKNEIDYDIAIRNADIEIFWGHPPYEFSDSRSYKIGFTAWESTGFKKGWLASMAEADEIWTPASWLTKHFMESTGKPGFTYPHGIDKEWKPFRHYRPEENEPFRFLHIGEPQLRKNGQMVVDAFVSVFGNDPKYQLIMKSAGINTTRIYNKQSGSIVCTPPAMYPNIIFIDSVLSKEQLIQLHSRSHALVYPTAGEGFGFHPLEALGAGLPTITTTDWCDYKEFVNIGIESGYSNSPWEDMHPGELFNPNIEDVKQAMIDMVENYEKYSKEAFKNSFDVHKKWSWDVVNNLASEKLKDIYFSRIMKK